MAMPSLVRCGNLVNRGKLSRCKKARGTEANEALYKLARKFGNETAPGGRHGIITMLNSFQGRTLAGIAATGQDKVKRGFEHAVAGFRPRAGQPKHGAV